MLEPSCINFHVERYHLNIYFKLQATLTVQVVKTSKVSLHIWRLRKAQSVVIWFAGFVLALC